MKLVLVLFTVWMYSLFLFGSESHNPAQVTNNLDVLDSLDVFNTITDVEKQMKKVVESQEETFVLPVSDTSQDNVKLQGVLDSQEDVNISDTIVRRADAPRSNKVKKQRTNYLDSLYVRKKNGTLELPDSLFRSPDFSGLTFKDTMIINPLFLPVVFTGKILPDDLSFYPPKPQEEDPYKGILISPENTFAPLLEKMEFINEVRRQYWRQYPERVKMSVFHFDTIPRVDTQKDVIEKFNPFKELIKVERTAPLEAPPIKPVEFGRKYWILSGEHSLQFSQNYFSENWHKGGTSNLNFNNYHVIRANYQKKNVRFNNMLEWRFSIYNSPEDTLRNYRIGEDLIRYYGNLGIDAFIKKWSYSMNTEIKSQLFNNYVPNTTTLRSALLSPLYVNVGIGMRYGLDKKSKEIRYRRVRLTLDLSPLSLNYRYVANSKVDVGRYGIKEGKKSMLDIGSTITSLMTYDITRYISWNSRFKYFTSYDMVEAEFENTLNMMLTQYFSTRLYLNIRFDDAVPADPTFKYFQINEVVSFGLNYRW
jgi:hypothetical protein